MRRLLQYTLILGLLCCGVSGCGGPGYGYYDYPAYGYAPYSYGWPFYARGYAPDFAYHHSWEEHHIHGHPGSFGGGHVGGFRGSHGGGFGGGHMGGGGHGGAAIDDRRRWRTTKQSVRCLASAQFVSDIDRTDVFPQSGDQPNLALSRIPPEFVSKYCNCSFA
jgi:hypothetical protein